MPSETTLLGTVAVTKPARNGERKIIIDTQDGRLFVIPLSPSAAESIGKDLTAPSVSIPATVNLPNGKS